MRTLIGPLILTWVIMAIVPSFGAAGTGVLAGLRKEYSTDLRTLWLVPRAGAASVMLEMPQLIVPRHNEFWRAGIQQTCDQGESDLWGGAFSKDTRHYLWAAPLRAQPVVRTQNEGKRRSGLGLL